jgi:hypothetical protein
VPPQTSQRKLPECLWECCSLVAVYGTPQLGQLKYSVVQKALAMAPIMECIRRAFQSCSLASSMTSYSNAGAREIPDSSFLTEYARALDADAISIDCLFWKLRLALTTGEFATIGRPL